MYKNVDWGLSVKLKIIEALEMQWRNAMKQDNDKAISENFTISQTRQLYLHHTVSFSILLHLMIKTNFNCL